VSENQGQEAVEEVKYAGFWIRVVATLIDAAIFWPFFWVLRQTLPYNWYSVVGSLISTIYYLWFVSSNYQGTPGKMLLRLKVTDLEGNRISFLRSIGRYMVPLICYLIFKLVSWEMNIENHFGLIEVIKWLLYIVAIFTLIVDYLMVAFTKRSQGLHDKIASTLVVVREKNVNQ